MYRQLGAPAPSYPPTCDQALQANPSLYGAVHPLWVSVFTSGDPAAQQLVISDCQRAANPPGNTALWITSGVAAASLVILALKWR